jgi:hypothetical protein
MIEWRRRCCHHTVGSSNGSPSSSDDWYRRCCHHISTSNGSPSGSIDICVPTISSSNGSPSGSVLDLNPYGGGYGRKPKN